MNILIRRLTISDFICNLFFKLRLYFFQLFCLNQINYKSNKNKKGFKLVFDDEFEKIDCSYDGKNTRWVVGESWGLFNPNYLKSYYVPIKKIYENTYAVFSVKYDPQEFNHPITNEKIIIPFATTKVSTMLSHKQKYGRFECRCTLPSEYGVWPAFWMWGETWPPEIDIFEVYGTEKGKTNNIQQINLHYDFIENKTKSEMIPWKIKVEDLRFVNDIFHEYAVEWTPNKIEFFIDGIKIFKYSRKDILDKYFNSSNANMGIVLGHSIEEKYVSEKDKSYSSEFLVDYVRIFEKIKN